MKFLHRFPRTCTEVLKISGGLTQNNPQKLPPFTEQIKTAIHTAYPNLLHLHISRYDFNCHDRAAKNITDLPPNLHGLYLTKCELLTTDLLGTLPFLQLSTNPARATRNRSFQQLERLSFENSSCLRSTSISCLPAVCPKLAELNLNGCFRVNSTPAFIEALIHYSPTLRRLYLAYTQITDDTIHSLCRKLKRLNVLDIKRCRHVTTNIVENLLTLRQLQKLIANDDILASYELRKAEGD